MIRSLLATLVCLVGVILLWSYVRGDEYASTTLYVSERGVNNVMTCISGKSGQIKRDLKRVSLCRPGEGGRRLCQTGMTYLSADSQMRLTVQPADGAVEIRIRHNQPLSPSAIATLERCAG